jgi:hypothetical protein
MRRHHTRQMRRASRSGNQHHESAPARLFRVGRHEVRRAVGRHHARFVGNAELGQHLGRVPHRGPIGFAPHDDPDQRLVLFHDISHADRPWLNQHPSADKIGGLRSEENSAAAAQRVLYPSLRPH